MATIDDLHESITTMSTEDLFKLHRDIRQSRRVSKRVTKATKKPKKEVNAAKLTKGMSEEDRRLLISELEEME